MTFTILTTNYDSYLEFACWASGMDMKRPGEPPTINLPSICRDYFRVLSNKASYESLIPDPSILYISKLHGSIDDALGDTSEWVDDDRIQLAIAFDDLTGWSVSRWAKSYFEDRIASRLILITGFSASDPYLFGTMVEYLPNRNSGEETPEYQWPNRIYAFDPNPGAYLEALVRRTGEPSEGLFSEPGCTACESGHMCNLGQWNLSIDKDNSKMGAKMSCLFSDLYCACIAQTLCAHLDTVGLPTLTALWGEDELPDAHTARDQISAFLVHGTLPTSSLKISPHDLIFEWLPKALLCASIMTASARVDILSQADKWSRPDFYYPVMLDLPLAYALLASLFCCAGLSNRPVIPRNDGGVDFFKGSQRATVLLVPALRGDTPTEALLWHASQRRFFSSLWSQAPTPLVFGGHTKDTASRKKSGDRATLKRRMKSRLDRILRGRGTLWL